MSQKQKKNIGPIDTNYLTMDKNNYKIQREDPRTQTYGKRICG